MRLLLIFIPLVFAVSLQSITAQNIRTLIQYGTEHNAEALKNEIIEQNGKILVEWPGGMWIFWENEQSDLKLSTESELLVRNYRDLNEWIADLGDILDEPLECDVDETEQSLLNRNFRRTSDSLGGHTVCALFFVNQPGGFNPWTAAEQEEILVNAGLNLAWWAELALLYDIEASFEIKPYFYDHPACQVSTDPTVETGISWKMEIMEQVGYNTGNILNRELDYTIDLINEYQSDWGFIAYIIRGASTYRSNARIFGPSTIVFYLAARSGLTFTHEVGHIFGLQDEYEERAFGVSGYSLNELPNLNADFRNLINAPCIMKTTASVGMCCYNAYHFGWTDLVEELTITTDPPDALFELAYISLQSGNPFQSRFFQGTTVLPVGRGQQIRLYSLDTIRVESGVYINGSWDINGHKFVEITDDYSIRSLHLSYEFISDADYQISYGEIFDMIPSRRIWGLQKSENGAIYIVSNQGTGVHRDGTFEYFDQEIEVRPGEFLTRHQSGHHISEVYHLENTWLISGSIPNERPLILLIQSEQLEEAIQPPQDFREQGFYTSSIMLEDGTLLAVFSGGGLHLYLPDGRMEIINTGNGLPDNGVSIVALDAENRILLGFDGGRTGAGFSGLFEFDLQTLQTTPYSAVPENVRTARISGLKFFEERTVLAVIAREKVYENAEGEWKEHAFGGQVIFDLDRIEEGRWAFGTASGLFYHGRDGRLIQRNRDRDYFQENFVRSVLALPNGTILAGHQNYGLTIYFNEEIISSVYAHPALTFLQAKIYPNPVNKSSFYISSSEMEGKYELFISDLSGKLLHRETVRMSATETLKVDYFLKPGIYAVSLFGEASYFSGLLNVVE